MTDTDSALEAALRRALDRRGTTVDPAEIARQVGGEGWHELVEPARRAARRSVAGGDFDIPVNGRICDLSRAKGDLSLRPR